MPRAEDSRTTSFDIEYQYSPTRVIADAHDPPVLPTDVFGRFRPVGANTWSEFFALNGTTAPIPRYTVVDVANQTELNAVATGGLTIVNITADFGVYYHRDELIWNTTTSAWVKLVNARDLIGGFSVWIGIGQTEELPEETLPAGSAVSTNGIKGYSSATPTRTDYGGVNATLTNISTETDADFSDDVDNSVIELPSGEYSFFGVFYGNQQPDANLHLRLEQIRTGTDDIIRINGTTRQDDFGGTGDNDVHAVFEINRPYYRITSAQKFYLRLVGFPANRNRLVGFLQIRRED